MKVNKLILFSILFLSFQISHGQTNDTIQNIKIDYEITYRLNFSIKAIFNSSNSSIKSDSAGTYMFIDQLIADQLKKQLAKNEKLKLDIKIPNYINDIINLIPSKEDRFKAKRIYINNNIINSIRMTYPDEPFGFKKKRSNSSYYSIFCEFGVPIKNQDLTFYIKPIVIKYRDKFYASNPLTVVLGNGSSTVK